jgi:hypothetical protein
MFVTQFIVVEGFVRLRLLMKPLIYTMSISILATGLMRNQASNAPRLQLEGLTIKSFPPRAVAETLTKLRKAMGHSR